MREALKRLTGESLVYGLGQVSGRAVQVLLIPVLTAALPPAVFGVGDLVQAYSALAILVLVLGMDGALVRFFYQEPDRESRRRMVTTSLVFRAIASVAAVVVLAAVATPISHGLFGSPDYRKYVVVGAVTIPFTLLVLLENDVLRVTFQPWKFIALNLVQTVIVAGLTLQFVLGMRLGVIGILYGKLGGDVVTGLVGLVLIRHSLTPRLDLSIFRKMVGFGAPLVPAALAYGIVSSADRYFLQRTHGLEDVGVYAVAVKFFTVVMMGVSAFSLAFFPFAHARSHTSEAPRLYARVLALYVAVATGLALAVSLVARDALALLVAPAYRGAADPARLLTFAAVAYGAYYVACLGVQLALRTSLLAWTGLAGAAVALAANLALAKPWGMMGVAAATLLGNVALAGFTYAASQSVYPLPYRGRRLLALFVFAVALGVGVPWLAPGGVTGVLARAGALAAYAFAVFGLDVWRDRGAITAAARQPTAPDPGA